MELIALGPDFGVEVRDIGLIDVASSDSADRATRAALVDTSCAKSAASALLRMRSRKRPSTAPVGRTESVADAETQTYAAQVESLP